MQEKKKSNRAGNKLRRVGVINAKSRSAGNTVLLGDANWYKQGIGGGKEKKKKNRVKSAHSLVEQGTAQVVGTLSHKEGI